MWSTKSSAIAAKELKATQSLDGRVGAPYVFDDDDACNATFKIEFSQFHSAIKVNIPCGL